MQPQIWTSLVPNNKREAIQKALTQTFGSTEIESIEPLTGGRSSALVYKVTVGGKPFVLRTILEVDALRDPHRHFTAMTAAAHAGIAPPVRYTDTGDAVSIVDFIEHAPLRTHYTTDKDLFCALATTIKAIHALPLFPKLVPFVDGVDALIERFKASDVLPPATTDEHFRLYSAVQRAYPRHEQNLVSAHNDLNPSNILHNNGKIWVIDWEVAFANDCYADLANVNLFFGSGVLGEATLLETYFGDALNDYHCARFFLMQQVCFMYVAMLFMHLSAATRKPDSTLSANMETLSLLEFQTKLRSGEISLATSEDYLLFAKVLLNESRSQMKTVRFKESIRLIEQYGTAWPEQGTV